MGLVRQHQKGDRPCGKREDAWRNKVGAPSVEYGKRQESRREEVRQHVGDAHLVQHLLLLGDDVVFHVRVLELAQALEELKTDRFHIAGVMGPDEYHDGYPDAPGEGVRDNSYTNVMVAWVCHRAGDALQELVGHARDDVIDRLRIDDAADRQP